MEALPRLKINDIIRYLPSILEEDGVQVRDALLSIPASPLSLALALPQFAPKIYFSFYYCFLLYVIWLE